MPVLGDSHEVTCGGDPFELSGVEPDPAEQTVQRGRRGAVVLREARRLSERDEHGPLVWSSDNDRARRAPGIRTSLGEQGLGEAGEVDDPARTARLHRPRI